MPDDLIREILAILQRGDRVELIPGKNKENGICNRVVNTAVASTQ